MCSLPEGRTLRRQTAALNHAAGLVGGGSPSGFRVLGAGEIAGAGADVEFAASPLDWAMTVTLRKPAGSVLGLALWIGEGVLATDVASHFGGDLVHLLERFGEEGDAASFAGEHLQGAAGVAYLAVGHFVAEEQADRVDDRAGKLLNAADGLFEVEGGGVVFAVGDDEDDLLGAAGAVGELIGGGDDGVVEGGTAAGLDVGQAVFELVGVAG